MDERKLTLRRLPRVADHGNWAWIAGGVVVAFVLVLLIALSTGGRMQIVSYSPPSVDGLVTPPITQPTR